VTGTNEDLRKEVFLSILDWTEDETSTNIVGGRANRVVCTIVACLPLALTLYKERDASYHKSNHFTYGGDHGAFLWSNNTSEKKSRDILGSGNDCSSFCKHDPHHLIGHSTKLRNLHGLVTSISSFWIDDYTYPCS